MSPLASSPAPVAVTGSDVERIGELRADIDACDADIIELVQKRLAISQQIGALRSASGGTPPMRASPSPLSIMLMRASGSVTVRKTRRDTSGRPRKWPGTAASSMNSPGTPRTQRNGPLPIGARTYALRNSSPGAIPATRCAGIGAT